MLSPEQINEIHRLHLVEKWTQRRIARHLHIGRHTGQVPGHSRPETSTCKNVYTGFLAPPRGAHLLLQTRTRVLNNELEETFRRWYPKFRVPSQNQEPKQRAA